MAANKIVVLAMTAILVIVGLMCVFTVKETELALMLRFGKVVSQDLEDQPGVHFKPGLHFKLPIYHTIRKFDKRIQTLDAQPEQFLTSEKKNLIVDSFVKWRIIDVVTYYTAVGGSSLRAKQRLGEMIADGLRSQFGQRTIKEVVSGDRAEIMDIITEEANERAKQFGIKIVDVRIKRIELPREVSSSVYRRMEAERERDAKKLRSQGEAEAVRIRAEADRKRIEVISDAERKAEEIRGNGDAEAADTYALAYNQNPEFYALYRSLNAYKATFNDRSDVLLIQPDSDFFNYFSNLNGKNPNLSMPIPESGKKAIESAQAESEPVSAPLPEVSEEVGESAQAESEPVSAPLPEESEEVGESAQAESEPVSAPLPEVSEEIATEEVGDSAQAESEPVSAPLSEESEEIATEEVSDSAQAESEPVSAPLPEESEEIATEEVSDNSQAEKASEPTPSEEEDSFQVDKNG
jgi:membrane protease subunit HflC